MIRHGHIKIISRDYVKKIYTYFESNINFDYEIVFANISNYNLHSLTAVGMIFINTLINTNHATLSLSCHLVGLLPRFRFVTLK